MTRQPHSDLTPWRVTSLVYQGHPAIVASHSFPDTRAHALRSGLESLVEIFGEYNFVGIDRYVSSPSTARNCTVALVESGCAVQFAGQSHFPGSPPPEPEWIELAKRRNSCLVIVTVGDMDEARANAHVRTQSGRKLCRGAEVEFVDQRTAGARFGNSRYRTLLRYGQDEFPRPATSIIHLDSNVVLDLEKAAKGRVPESLHDELKALVRNLWYQDCRPGFSIGELCWTGPYGRYRRDRKASLLAAMDAWFDDKSDTVLSRNLINQRWANALAVHKEQETESQLPDMRDLIALNYCSLLKLCSLLLRIRGFKARQRIDYLFKYSRWVDRELGCVSTYALQVAIDALIGQPTEARYIRKLLKFSRSILNNVWGAAWDLSMLMITDWTDSGQFSNSLGFRSGLVTADKAMLDLRDHLTFEGTMAYKFPQNWHNLMGIQVWIDPRLNDHKQIVRELLDELKSSTIARMESSVQYPDVAKIRPKIAQLEALVIVESNKRR